MPGHLRDLSEQSKSVVHLDVDAQHLVNLLSFLDNGSEARTLFDWATLESIVETAARYRFEIVPEMVARLALKILRTKNGPKDHAFQIFKFAARHDYADLAKFAVSLFNRTALDFTESVGEVNCEWFDGVPGRYVAALFISMSNRGEDDIGWDWKMVSGDFHVDQQLGQVCPWYCTLMSN